MTASEQIMAVMATRGRATTAEISGAVEASQGAVYVALSKLVDDGELVRLEPGFYAMNIDGHPAPAAQGDTERPARETKPRKRATKRRNGKTPPPVADAESSAEPLQEDPADPPMELAVWHTGEVTVRRADQVVVLNAAEVGTLLRFLGRFTQSAGAR